MEGSERAESCTRAYLAPDEKHRLARTAVCGRLGTHARCKTNVWGRLGAQSDIRAAGFAPHDDHRIRTHEVRGHLGPHKRYS